MFGGGAGAVGAGVTLFGLLAILFGLLVNALLKTSSKSDEINERLVSQAKETIADKDRVIAGKDREIEGLKNERDHWFRMYDDERNKGAP